MFIDLFHAVLFLTANNTAISLYMYYICMFFLANWQYVFRVSCMHLKVALLNIHISLYIYGVLTILVIQTLSSWKVQRRGTYWAVFIPPTLFFIAHNLLFHILVFLIFATLLITKINPKGAVNVFFFPLGLLKDSAQLHLSLQHFSPFSKLECGPSFRLHFK